MFDSSQLRHSIHDSRLRMVVVPNKAPKIEWNFVSFGTRQQIHYKPPSDFCVVPCKASMIDFIDQPDCHACIPKHGLVGMKGLKLRLCGPPTAIPRQAVLGASRCLHRMVDFFQGKNISNKLSLLLGFFENQIRLGSK
jgi:hypothetical protein